MVIYETLQKTVTLDFLAWQGPIAVRMAKLAINQGIEVSLRGQSRTAFIFFGVGVIFFLSFISKQKASQVILKIQQTNNLCC